MWLRSVWTSGREFNYLQLSHDLHIPPPPSILTLSTQIINSDMTTSGGKKVAPPCKGLLSSVKIESKHVQGVLSFTLHLIWQDTRFSRASQILHIAITFLNIGNIPFLWVRLAFPKSACIYLCNLINMAQTVFHPCRSGTLLSLASFLDPWVRCQGVCDFFSISVSQWL